MPAKAPVPKSVSKSKASSTTEASFSPPAEAEWHRMISEAAYLRAERRGFAQGNELEDWLLAESDVREALATRPKPRPRKTQKTPDS